MLVPATTTTYAYDDVRRTTTTTQDDDDDASPRASIALFQAARAHAFMRKRGYVSPEDVKAIAADVLRHRVILSYEAEAEGKTVEQIIRTILEHVHVP